VVSKEKWEEGGGREKEKAMTNDSFPTFSNKNLKEN